MVLYIEYESRSESDRHSHGWHQKYEIELVLLNELI